MARKLRIAAIIVTAAAAIVAGLFVAAYIAMQRVESFYAEALELEPQAAAEGSRETESRAAALYNDARKSGGWQAKFTDEELNGWMAVQLGENAERALPSDVSAPRVAFGDGSVSLGFQTRQGGIDTVVTVQAAVHLTENDEVAVRFNSVQAGALPLPVMQVAEKISAACRELDLPIRWTRAEGLPVALVDISSMSDSDDHRIVLDAIELAAGTLLIAGHTEEADGSTIDDR